MKIVKFLTFVFFLNIFHLLCYAQDYKKEVIVIGGVKYVLHEVRSGETIFSLCKNYQIDTKELISSNPNLIQGLKVGDVLKIPIKDFEPQENTIVEQQKEPDKFIIHKIQRRETPFFISKKYGIPIEDIYKYNPDLKKFKRGEKIRIPQFEDVSVEVKKTEPGKEKEIQYETTGSEMLEHRVQPDETLFSISRLYSRPISEILYYNPEAQSLKIGMVIKLPREKNNITVEFDSVKEGEFIFHTVEIGETLYGLCRKYNVSEPEMKNLNPLLESGFPAGVRLRIPVSNMPEMKVTPVNDNAFTRHIVIQGETLYQLSTKYNLTKAEIKKFNPALETREGLLTGETIMIPKKVNVDELNEFAQENRPLKTFFADSFYEVETIVEVPEECRPANRRGYFFDTYHIGLLLPLFLQENEALNFKPQLPDTSFISNILEYDIEPDTIEKEFTPEEQIWKFYNNSENFLHFYEGVLVAVDSMQKRGMNVKLHVYDTRQDVHTVDSLLTTNEFLDLDLIIGPIYPQLQKSVAGFAAKNRIPMVSPLSSEGNIVNTNPYYFQVYPSQEFLMMKTAQFIADEYYNSNNIVLQTGIPTEVDNLLVEMCREKLFNSEYYRETNEISFSLYDFNKLGGQGIPRILSKTRENVFIIPTFDEGKVSIAVSNINNNTSDFNITVFGNSRYKQFESIDQEYFHNTKLKYFYPYWTDYNSPATVSFYNKFREYFKTDPTQFSIQGYDVAFFFLNAFWNHGKNFYDCLPYMNTDLVQGKYKFEKVSRFGGYMNHGVSLISYKKDYTVVKEKISGEIRYVYK